MSKKAVQAMEIFLEGLGVDLKAVGMEKTPERVAGMYEYLFNGIGVSTDDVWGELFKVDNEGIVAVRDIPFYS
uniref:GTP cyclohydrolase I n=1 Tax=uncultured Anaerovibrio sp. TaxID=361586 RepID=UPI0026276845